MRPVYNGYEEYFWTGKEIKEYFSDAYGRFGRHNDMIASHRMNMAGFKKLVDDKEFRVFLNDTFCAIFEKEKDRKLYFFGFTKERPAWAKD